MHGHETSDVFDDFRSEYWQLVLRHGLDKYVRLRIWRGQICEIGRRRSHRQICSDFGPTFCRNAAYACLPTMWYGPASGWGRI
jgi:hypothetical protein